MKKVLLFLIILAAFVGYWDRDNIKMQISTALGKPMKIARGQTTNENFKRAIEEHKPVIIYFGLYYESHPDWNPLRARNAYFFLKFLDSYKDKDKAIIIDAKSGISYRSRDDYAYRIMNLFAKQKSRVIIFNPSKSNTDTLYFAKVFKGIETPDIKDLFATVKEEFEPAFGPIDFDYKKLIRQNSVFSQFNKAAAQKGKIVLMNFEQACPAGQQYKNDIVKLAKDKPNVLVMDSIINRFEDPAAEAWASCKESFICVYDTAAKSGQPANPPQTRREFDEWLSNI
ncbi:MAG: hypothetical protein LBG46_03530 [Elusimicrobiota bacterium]|jgi:ABC-type ATPase with predicted acetyltransferase domain|nr:hypothetical protein [Elusimicrobiota bacterium]